jgi:hypothetical protein
MIVVGVAVLIAALAFTESGEAMVRYLERINDV